MSLYNLSQTPQFKTAEPAATAGSEHCVSCNQPITARYYRVNTRIACESCAQELERQQPKDSHAAYVRGLLFGAGAAILGMIGYAGFTIVTGIYLGYISLAVGWLVGKGIMLGSNGQGGRRYQIAAVALTYAAVSMAAIPIALAYRSHNETAAKQARQQLRSTDSENPQPELAQNKPTMSLGAAILQLLLIGLASPFLELADPFHGIIGLVILMVGIRIAWKLTKGSTRTQIAGPFNVSAAAV
ncbi:MAG TPA: hypothetical protein VGJ33_02925 [Candidatus Angelobacter sp.]|jgi:hypothetical protein